MGGSLQEVKAFGSDLDHFPCLHRLLEAFTAWAAKASSCYMFTSEPILDPVCKVHVNLFRLLLLLHGISADAPVYRRVGVCLTSMACA